ncbi:response regulator transcription factor [Moellerella wisconsensis]|uniref:LuxR C-terminal-related transcriptional regulator n=2 Tax=Moellerella wisconsensis TaxID=158849 RepID=A0A9Q8V3H0_9GAMM|nr:LuxR C-terminal-related transcriptional regulator [Moellerella wisconsensis]UNH23625.1 LuxR C-terminal-related transcriptional regulator [Moellerella wisconsensis]UNH26713.1 LuxR C-terminal-related transcriptional regulator [Moellerella wisconsensis]UNH30197.1 LuxR C-terminal-related transcriptional regulator [Moellerella wisconsensis]
MEKIIHIIMHDDNATKNKLELIMESIGGKIRFYKDEQSFISNYTYPVTNVTQECIIKYINNEDCLSTSGINALNNKDNIIPVIIITEKPSIEICRDSFKNGAFEYFHLPLKGFELQDAINNASDVFKRSFERYQLFTSLSEKFKKLSNREKEVMAMILDGNTSKEAAEKLSLSPRTVEVHRSNIYTKLKIKSLPQLVNEYSYIITYTENI